ncbi:STAS domain-containing protein [Paenisporosarcina quisquiliarum]|uniref:STAS domain-containing protein n=1 Tax=Paenisporosarcina quisquiliarum TaxID=365346 RepID=A0A9X3LFQ4_9BACL|nr:STAS domain-containing protein [Paenisporosarcina quisquiliarum]MCZ8537058.1 STAS domain-containing protein [Paenisporosarcina quisquiliarum]
MSTFALLNYLKEQADQITEDWLNARATEPGSFYSCETSPDVERLLRKQHKQTVQLLISSLYQDETEFLEKLEDWAQTVAMSRVENRIAIHVVVEFLGKTRALFWQYIHRFIHDTNVDVDKNSVAEWSEMLHSGFDKMIVKFTEYYHAFNETRLSEHQALIKLLEIPLIKICDKVSVLPLIGVINSERGLSLLNDIPLKCSENKVESLIIDLSGVIQIEEAVAFQLTQLVQVFNLMGIESYISGIRPEVARNAISFGRDFHTITKISSVQEVIGKHTEVKV